VKLSTQGTEILGFGRFDLDCIPIATRRIKAIAQVILSYRAAPNSEKITRQISNWPHRVTMMRAISGASCLAVSALFITAPLSIAGAADMAVKAPRIAPVAAPVYSWTGCYLGGNTGGAWARDDAIEETFDGTPQVNDTGTARVSGWAYGGQVGCDYQFNSNWVAGVRGMWDGSTMKGNAQWPAVSEDTTSYKINSFGTVVGKLGYLVAPTVELYGLGGVAWARNGLTWTNSGVGDFLTGAQTQTGYDVGVGLSWMFAPNWDLWVEYDYMGFETKNVSFIGEGIAAGDPYTANISLNVQKVLLGIDYRISWGNAPVATPLITK
jgi:outer membrane immunogenic protein